MAWAERKLHSNLEIYDSVLQTVTHSVQQVVKSLLATSSSLSVVKVFASNATRAGSEEGRLFSQAITLQEVLLLYPKL